MVAYASEDLLQYRGTLLLTDHVNGTTMKPCIMESCLPSVYCMEILDSVTLYMYGGIC